MTKEPAMSLNARAEPRYINPNIMTRTPPRRVALDGFSVFGFMVLKWQLNGVALSWERAQNIRPTMVKPPIAPINVGMNETMGRPTVAALEPVA
jgi:hypothetical protein